MQHHLTRRRALQGSVALASVIVARAAPHTLAKEGTPVPTSSLGWTDSFDGEDTRLNVATTVAPISSIARNIGGTRIDLHGIVPDGTNSHTFEPAPSDAVLLSKADMVVVNGLQLEQPTIELAEANMTDDAEFVLLGDQTITADEYVYDFSFPEEDGKPNPHLWMNPMYALEYARLIAAALSARDAANAGYYSENLARYEVLLNQLDAGIMAATATIPQENRKLLTYHDSYAYFAPRYGLTVIGAAQPSDFSEPSAQDVANLIDQIRESGVPAVFGSEVFPSPVLEQIAEEAGAEYIDELRDDAPPGEPNAPEHTYVGMMLRNMELMIPALGGSTEALEGIPPYDTYLP
ncbi:MAG: metal ABC transporter substrate-binding protein [Chloroflexota bacterium]|nr:metal ABC transporter substrate-binding protein [Chloroflexota bacterium]